MPNLYRNNIDFINFLPKRKWDLSIREGLFSKNKSFLLKLELNAFLGLKVAILKFLKPEFVAVKMSFRIRSDVKVAIHHLKKIPNFKALWLYDLNGNALYPEWAELDEVEYLFLKGCGKGYSLDLAFLKRFKKNKNIKKISFGHPALPIQKQEKEAIQLDRLELIRASKGENVFIAFPSDIYPISRDLKILKQICEITGLSTVINRGKFKIILHSGENNKWQIDHSELSFHTYMTVVELKEWIFELLNYTKLETKEENDFSVLADFFESKQDSNILIALNILKHNEGINRDTFALIVSMYQSYALNKSADDNVLEIKKLLEEIMVKHVPAPVSAHLKSVQSKSSVGKDGILNLELLKFFQDFDVNFCQIQRALLLGGPYEFNFLINLDKGEELPDIIEQLKPDLHTYLTIRFIGKGNIVPNLNKASNFIKKPYGLNIISTEKDGLDIGLSNGKVNACKDNLTFTNFYCSNASKIQFPNIKSLKWNEGGNLMQNIGECFPALAGLQITKSKINRLDISSAKETLFSLEVSYVNWDPSYNQYLKDLVNLKSISINNAGLKIIPQEILNMKDLKRIFFSSNLISNFPTSFSTLEKLRYLDISANKIKRLPTSLEFSNLEELKLFKNEFNIVNFSTDKSPKLKKVNLGWSNMKILSSEFLNHNLSREIEFMIMMTMNVELPPIEEISISPEDCLAKFNFNGVKKLDYKTQIAYSEKYPDNFKF